MLPTAVLFTLLLLGSNPNTTVFYSSSTADLYVIGDAGSNALKIDNEAGYSRVWTGSSGSINGIRGPTEFPVGRVLGRLIVSLGDGNDAVHFTTPLAEHRIFHLGAGNDFLDMGGVGSERTEVYAGSGDDHVHAEDCFIGDLSVSLGSGADDFEVAFSFVERSFVAHGGAGDDVMRLRQAEFLAGPVRLAGGSGADAFLDLESWFFAPPKLVGFENGSRSRVATRSVRQPVRALLERVGEPERLPDGGRRRRSDHAAGARPGVALFQWPTMMSTAFESCAPGLPKQIP
jgi:hypothetical protein